MPNPSSNAQVPFVFDVKLKVTPDDKQDPVVYFEDLPHPSGKGLETAEAAVEDHGPGILYVDVPDNSGLLDA